jgi:hypothetical protein
MFDQTFSTTWFDLAKQSLQNDWMERKANKNAIKNTVIFFQR